MPSDPRDLIRSARFPPQVETLKCVRGRNRKVFPVVSRTVGDRLVFEQLHQRLHMPVWRKVNYLIQNEEEAKDIVQETFMKLWYNGPFFGPGSNVDDWVYRVALNGGKDYLKSAWRRYNISLDQDISARGDDRAQMQVEEGIEERICEAALCSQVLGKLKEMERICLVLSSIWELKQSEIAECMKDILGCEVTVKQVEHAIYRAKKAFRRLYPNL